jgi:DNA topoisomerase-1
LYKTVKERGYVRLTQKRLVPTDEGIRLCDFLTQHFNDVLAVDYTARLEAQLDAVASGERTRLAVLREFWAAFQPQLQAAASSMPTAAAPTPRPLILHPLEG